MGIKVYPEAKALIFDMDGTLTDSMPVHIAAWVKTGEKYGFTYNPKMSYEMTGRPVIEFAWRILEESGISADPEELVRMKYQFFKESGNLLKPFEEILSIVKEYHGKLPMAVGTGGSRESAEFQLKELQIDKYFDVIVTADDVTGHKPDPDTFLKCAELMGVEPSSCQVFEDGDLGIEAAKRAGMMVIDVRPHINYGEWTHL